MKTFETELGLEYNSPMHIYRCGESLCLNSDLGMIREIIKAAMKEKRITAKAVAEHVGITPGSMSLFLSGKMDLRISNLEKILIMLDIKLSF